MDPRLTGHAGVAAVTELDRVLGIGQALDAGIGQVKQRRRGCTAGELLVSMASAQLAGAEFLVGMDRRREDHAGQALEPVPTPASTTTAQLAQRFTPTHLAGIEAGIGTVNRRVMALLPENRREQLLVVATIDGDTTDVEVYGRKKQDAVYNYQGQRAYRPHIAFWAEGGTTLAADLMRADEDPRPVAADLLDRAVAALPPGVDKIRCRWDSGYFAVDLARHCVEKGVDFAIGVKRNTAVVRASRVGPVQGWHPAIGMEHTEVAVIEYLPGKWPKDAGIACIARRTRIPVDQIPTDKRARKLRTIDKDQLALALAGQLDYVYGYSFILTNLDVSTPARLAAVEHWYRLNQVSQEATSSQTTKYVRDPAGTLIGMQGNGGANFYYTLDNVGSVILLTNNSQTTAAAYTYDAFGNTLTSSGGQANVNHYRYATGYTDPTGLIKMGARYYNPTTGHFTQPDPSGQEANRYAYASNNPTTHNDPTGLCGEWYSLVGCDQLLEDQSSERSCLFWGVAGGAGAVVPAVIAGGPISWAAAGSLAAIGCLAGWADSEY